MNSLEDTRTYGPLQAAVHAGARVFYTRKIGGVLIISIHKATRILVVMKLSLETAYYMLSFKLLSTWVGSYRWGFFISPLFFFLFYIQPNVLTSTFLVGWHSPEHPWTVWHPRQRLWWRLHSNVLHGLWLGARSSWIEIGRGQFPAATTRLIMMIMLNTSAWYMSPFPLFLLCSHFLQYSLPTSFYNQFVFLYGSWSVVFQRMMIFFLRPCLPLPWTKVQLWSHFLK